MFRIKICGITNVEDALSAVEAGADAIGLNFYSGSKRCVNHGIARMIVDAVDGRLMTVGVFVNASAEVIGNIHRDTSLRIFQLHGEEWPDSTKLLLELGSDPFTIIRAHNLGHSGMRGVYESMFDPSGLAADAVLVDAAVNGMYGGTGRTIDWRQLIDYKESIGAVPLILAGGLTPENVYKAICTVRPHGVDTASGVESSPGRKDLHKVRDFVAEARRGFAEIGTF